MWFSHTCQCWLCICTNVVALILLYGFSQIMSYYWGVREHESGWEERMTHGEMGCILFQLSHQGDHGDCGICSLGLEWSQAGAVFKSGPTAEVINSQHTLSPVTYGILMQYSIVYLYLHLPSLFSPPVNHHTPETHAQNQAALEASSDVHHPRIVFTSPSFFFPLSPSWTFIYNSVPALWSLL